jgi:hypothetical protein
MSLRNAAVGLVARSYQSPPRGSSLGRIYVSSFGCLVCQYHICVRAHAHLEVGSTRFLKPASPHHTVANVRWSYLIALTTSLNLPRHIRAVLLQG